MKQRKSIIMIVMLLFASCIMSSCQSEEKKYETMGMTFTKIKDTTGYYFRSYYKDDEDNYLCVIDGQKAAQETLSVPAKYKRKKVVAVTAQNNNATVQTLKLSEGILYVSDGFESFTALKSIDFPKSLEAIYNAFAKCTALESLTFPGPVKKIGNHSFDDCTALKDLDFKETIDVIENSFKGCTSLTKVILPPKSAIRLDPFTEETKVLRGDRDVIAFSEVYIDSDQIKAQALTHLAETFDDQLKRAKENMHQFRDQVNGPIVTMDRVPDCLYKEYGKDKLPKSLALETVEVYTAQNDYPNTLYSKEKAEKIKNNEPIIYCFAEMIGYGVGPRYTFGGTNVGSYLHYRLSVWNFNTNELLGWCTADTGYAPWSFTWGKDTITFGLKFGETGTKRFFLESDKSQPTPLYVVEKYIFTQEPKKEETSSKN